MSDPQFIMRKKEEKPAVIKNRYLWILAFMPIVFGGWVILFNWSQSSEALSGPLGVVLIALLFFLIFLNSFSLVSKDEEINGMKYCLFWEKMLTPVYLFIRAMKTDQNYWPAFVWCVNFLIIAIPGCVLLLSAVPFSILLPAVLEVVIDSVLLLLFISLIIIVLLIIDHCFLSAVAITLEIGFVLLAAALLGASFEWITAFGRRVAQTMVFFIIG